MKIKDIMNGEYSEILGLEVLNNFPNSYGLEFTDKELEEYATNTNKIMEEGLLSPNLKISHSDQQLILKELFSMTDADAWEELPNLGLLENFRKEGKRVLADVKKIPSKLKDLIFGGKLFTSLSPELVLNWRETGKNIIRAVSLTNIPSMKHVTDVHMSEGLCYRGSLTFQKDGGTNMGDTTVDVAKIIDETLEKKTEGIVAKFSESIAKFFKKEEEPVVDKNKGEKMISLSEVQAMIDKANSDNNAKINELNLKLIEKDEKQKMLSEDVAKQKATSRKETVEAICEKARLDGVPPVMINKLKPILLSDIGEKTIKFSNMVDGKQVEAEDSLTNIIKDVFKNYPDKVKLNEISEHRLSDPTDEKAKMEKVEKRAAELQAQGKDRHTALSMAGVEILGGGN